MALPRGWPLIARRYSSSNSRNDRRIIDLGVDEQWLLSLDVIVVRHGPLGGIYEREMVALETLVAELAAEKQVRPVVGQPVIAGPNERILGPCR